MAYEQAPQMRLNPTTLKYEYTVILEVEEEFVRHEFTKYLEENRVDLSNNTDVLTALGIVRQVSHWEIHPRTNKRYSAVSALSQPQPQPQLVSIITQPLPPVAPAQSQKEKAPVTGKQPKKAAPTKKPRQTILSHGDRLRLAERARNLPMELWEKKLVEELLPIGDHYGQTPEQKRVYDRRAAQHEVLTKVRKEMETHAHNGQQLAQADVQGQEGEPFDKNRLIAMADAAGVKISNGRNELVTLRT